MRRVIELWMLVFVVGFIVVGFMVAVDRNPATAIGGDTIESAEAQAAEQILLWENALLRAELEQLKAGNLPSDFHEPHAVSWQPEVVSGSYWSTPQGFAVGQLLEYRASLRHTLIGDEPTAWGKY